MTRYMASKQECRGGGGGGKEIFRIKSLTIFVYWPSLLTVY